jgi:putative ABC transport system permease protein
MNFLISFETGLREIASHKFRSFLSMLGILLGVSSLVATLALTHGIERGARQFMTQMGGLEMVTILDKNISEQMLDFWNLSPGRTLQDAHAIRAAAPLISYVAPEIDEPMPVSSDVETMRVRVRGVWPEYVQATDSKVAFGRSITDLDVERGARAAVIGATVAGNLWPNLPAADIIGKTVFISQAPFAVVGVFQLNERESDRKARERAGKQPKQANIRQRTWDPFRWKNEAVIIPLTTMFYEFQSGKYPDDSVDTVRLRDLTVRVANLEHFRAALDQLRTTLMTTHRGVDDFEFETREDWFDNMNASLRATRTSGGLIAAISLIVGGIGIANIMLASITERVREIGIRLAVGAQSRDIFLQILIESVTIAVLGGLLGVVAGIALIGLLNVIAPSDNTPFVTLGSMVLSVGFAALAGVLSGIYPAIQASRLDPIQALRYE